MLGSTVGTALEEAMDRQDAGPPYLTILQVPVLLLVSATSWAEMFFLATKSFFSTIQPTKGVLTSPYWSNVIAPVAPMYRMVLPSDKSLMALLKSATEAYIVSPLGSVSLRMAAAIFLPSL